jgi:hypothetical protein
MMTQDQALKLATKHPRTAAAFLVASDAHNEQLKQELAAARAWLDVLAVAYVDILRRDLIDIETGEVKKIIEFAVFSLDRTNKPDILINKSRITQESRKNEQCHRVHQIGEYLQNPNLWKPVSW